MLHTHTHYTHTNTHCTLSYTTTSHNKYFRPACNIPTNNLCTYGCSNGTSCIAKTSSPLEDSVVRLALRDW